MRYLGIVSYNIYCNFTNYGSALQSWALSEMVNKLGQGRIEGKLIDYCPDSLKDIDTLDPIKRMWDKDEESRHMCELSLPAIEVNYKKFIMFYNKNFKKTKKSYTSENFCKVIEDENINGFICGSDTIFCIDEFGGFDNGYYANFPCMKYGYTVAYAASFGDAHFTQKDLEILSNRLNNFKALGLRENNMIDFAKKCTSVPVQKVLDPTLLLTSNDYEKIVAERQEEGEYLLLYVRRYNSIMEEFAQRIANENNWKIVEISLRATNAKHHRIFYEAGVEEFLSLVKYASCVVTNSFHGMIFSIQYRKPFYVFSREQCDSKISELLSRLGLSKRLLTTEDDFNQNIEIDYNDVHARIDIERKRSIEFLEYALINCP